MAEVDAQNDCLACGGRMVWERIPDPFDLSVIVRTLCPTCQTTNWWKEYPLG